MALPLISLSINVCLAQNTQFTVERSIQKTPEKFKEFQNSRHGEDFYLLVDFEKLPGKEEIAKLEKYQIDLLEYQSGKTYMAAIPADLDPSILQSLNIHTVANASTESKMDARLFSKDYPDWTIVENGKVDVAIVFHEKTNQTTIQNFLQQYNPTILEDKHRGNTTVVVRVPQDKIESIANSPIVAFIDLKQEPIQILNHECRINQKANVLNSVLGGGFGLNGQGVAVGVGDGGELGDHIDFGDRVINKASGTYNSFGDHGDHVSGIIGGAGNLNPRHKGMAPEATIITQKTSQITYNTEDYFNNLGMVLTNNSYGTSFNCNTNGSYNYSAQTLDWQLREFPKVLHVFAAGNSGGGTCEPYPQGYHSVLRYYQSAKNVLTVGMAEENRVIAGSSSRGPVKDGRLKPEIIGIGRNVISTSRDFNYSTKGGTSMAAPAVTGTLALLVEKYRLENNGENPDGALLKAVACNTADDLGNPGPDFIYGFGLINGMRAAEVIQNNQFRSDEIADGEMNVEAINVPSGTKQLKVMLYWPDKEAAVYPDKALVNDLNISIITPQGETILPWVLDPSAEGVANNAERGIDDLNNIEQITIDVPASGLYTVVVSGTSVPFGPQPFYMTYDLIQEEVVLTHPFGGESFVPGEKELISWDADNTNTNTFELEYSIDGGGTWLQIAPALPATQRSYKWTVPNVYTPDALIRVSKNGSNTTGSNATYFNIMDTPNNLIATPTCEKNIILNWEPSEFTTVYEVCKFDGNEMTVVGTTEDTTFVVEDEMEIGTDYWFSVRALGMNNSKSQRIVAVAGIPEDIEICPWEDNPVIILAGTFSKGREKTSRSLGGETISIEVKNIGGNDLQNFEMYYSINGGTPVQETFNGLVESGDSILISFDTPADLSAAGIHYVDTWVEIVGNNYHYLDSLNHTMIGEQLANKALFLPFEETFETISSSVYTGDVLGLEGCSKWDVMTNGNGEIESSQGGVMILRPLGSTNAMANDNNLILTLNMSHYADMDNEIDLNFNIRTPYTGSTTVPDLDFNNTVSVRGNDMDEWIIVKNLDEILSSWTTIDDVNITEILTEHGQTYTTSFQIKFTNDNEIPFSISQIGLNEKVENGIEVERLPDDFFTIEQVNNDVKLTWAPINTEGVHFEIELLDNFHNNTDFDVIGSVLAESTTTEPYFYTFTDKELGKKGERFYRIKQINADGTIAFSPVLSVTFSDENLNSVFPNPFVDQLKLAYAAKERSTIQVLVTSQDGKIVQMNEVEVNTGEQTIPIQIKENLPGGIYFLKVIDGFKTTCHKLIKQ